MANGGVRGGGDAGATRRGHNRDRDKERTTVQRLLQQIELQQIEVEMNVESMFQRDIKRGFLPEMDAHTFNDVWLCWSFQTNFMYSPVL